MPQVPQTFREGCGEKPPTFFFDYSCNGVTGAIGALGRSEGDLRWVQPSSATAKAMTVTATKSTAAMRGCNAMVKATVADTT